MSDLADKVRWMARCQAGPLSLEGAAVGVDRKEYVFNSSDFEKILALVEASSDGVIPADDGRGDHLWCPQCGEEAAPEDEVVHDWACPANAYDAARAAIMGDDDA